MFFFQREQIFTIFVDKKGFVLGEDTVSYGGLDGAYLAVAVFMRKAVRMKADSSVLAHNHPSGTLLPSGEDVKLIEYVRKSLNLLRIGFKGHYVLAGGKSRKIDCE